MATFSSLYMLAQVAIVCIGAEEEVCGEEGGFQKSCKEGKKKL